MSVLNYPISCFLPHFPPTQTLSDASPRKSRSTLSPPPSPSGTHSYRKLHRRQGHRLHSFPAANGDTSLPPMGTQTSAPHKKLRSRFIKTGQIHNFAYHFLQSWRESCVSPSAWHTDLVCPLPTHAWHRLGVSPSDALCVPGELGDWING